MSDTVDSGGKIWKEMDSPEPAVHSSSSALSFEAQVLPSSAPRRERRHAFDIVVTVWRLG